MSGSPRISAASPGKRLLEWAFIATASTGAALAFMSNAAESSLAVPLFLGAGIGTLILALRGRPKGLKSSPVAHFFDVALSIALFLTAMLLLGDEPGAQSPGPHFWMLVIAAWLFAWATVTHLSDTAFSGPAKLLFDFAIPALFGLTVPFLWEAIVRGAGVPFVLLPPPLGSLASALLAMQIIVIALQVWQRYRIGAPDAG